MNEETRAQVAQTLGMKTTEVVEMERDGDSWIVTTHDRILTRVTASDPEPEPDPEPEIPKRRPIPGGRRG